MKKKLLIIFLFSSIAFILSGCSEFNQPISADNEGLWNEFIVWPIVLFISYFAKIFGSYAIAIIIVTLIIRLAILPLTIKQINNSKKMQSIQPKLKELQAKYSSKDKNTQQEYQQEMMKLMSLSGANPIAGCIPFLIQMPILIGLYHAISRMNVTSLYELGSFFSVHLAEPSIIFGIIAGLMQFIVLQTGPTTESPHLKIPKYIIPIMVTVFGMISPAALSLYWIIGSTVSVIQNLIIYKPWQKEQGLITT